jgi:hypothetical protein
MSLPIRTEASTMLPTAPDRFARLPLRAELYLIAHHDDTGRPHIHPTSLAAGLAGAILLELWLAHRVAPGWTYDLATGGWRPAPGRIAVADPTPIGDPIADAALATIRHDRHTGPPDHHLKGWLRQFAAADLFHRVRANMVAVGVLRHTSHRRLGLTRTDRYLPADHAWPVRARAQIRSIVHNHHRHADPQPDDQQIALVGLADTLQLAPHLLATDVTAARLHHVSRSLIHHRDPTIGHVLTTVDAIRGDIAVAALHHG